MGCVYEVYNKCNYHTFNSHEHTVTSTVIRTVENYEIWPPSHSSHKNSISSAGLDLPSSSASVAF